MAPVPTAGGGKYTLGTISNEDADADADDDGKEQ